MRDSFVHGLSYKTFTYTDLTLSTTDLLTYGEVKISCRIRNPGDRTGAEVVQLYTADPIAHLPRPVTQLTGFARVHLTPGQERQMTFRLHADRLAYTGADLRRVVEPGEITVMIGGTSPMSDCAAP
ncbi:fibronectin type III-like domain-contianing protein [Streptomyces sp. NPDC096057]|uniref:fibronectin type III-like domain-contianing protein n=1 Tax=Streptomyces sp. NPDC096057 TaxID=3155543 RepID=UPI0033244EBA